MSETSTFELYAKEYDCWFDTHPNIYQSELAALEKVIPKNKIGLEIGAGTGRFSQPFNIRIGVEPAENMAIIAEKRGMKIYRASAEQLPFENNSFDFVLMVTTDCFLSDPPTAFNEVYRILKSVGEFIVGLIDKNSPLGKKYQEKKSTSKFYRDAHFHSTAEITGMLKKTGFDHFKYWQTLTENTQDHFEPPQEGYGQGGFVIITAKKK